MSVYKISFGTPEETVPSKFAPHPLCEVYDGTALFGDKFSFKSTRRGSELSLPVDPSIEIYGFGLQLKRFNHKGTKKYIRPNSDPIKDTGDTHAPVPFFVTNAGFGIYVDTARYATFYCGRELRPTAGEVNISGGSVPDIANADGSTFVDALYAVREGGENNVVTVDIPTASGVDVYYITGENILSVVSQYNMLSGGGCMPPMWGLGCCYRADMRFSESEVLAIARELRMSDIPCDVLGLEPSWQTRTYSSSFVWNTEKFPDPEGMVDKLRKDGFRVNLWEQSFIHPSSPLFSEMLNKSGNYLVWNGLVPDYALESARKTLADYHKTNFVDMGISSFKLDECDSGDYTGGWSFPDHTSFPSGADGEQYHALFGTLYSQAVTASLGPRRTFGQIRNLGSLAASYPYVLYSDLYNHKDFVLGVVNSGFSGLLWAPEVRHAENREDMLRRIETAVFSAETLINACYLRELPWKKHGCTDEVRELLRTRMSLVPYLFSAFYEYHTMGKPPVRALVCDFSEEPESLTCENEYLFGDSMIVAPIISGTSERDVWLPSGEWYDFFTGQKYEGGTHHVTVTHIPVFVRGGTLLPVASPVNYIDRNTCFNITLHAYGSVDGNTSCTLVSDSDETYNATYTVHTVTLSTRGSLSPLYNITGVEIIK
ncbi:MAG: glycoside hydrolase [Clostridia bacterium]|nr:glycoside hydrolase [Clostridia bacterium]